jgi:hypothetical protein
VHPQLVLRRLPLLRRGLRLQQQQHVERYSWISKCKYIHICI